MNKKNILKKTLSTVVISTCAMITIPVVANSVISNNANVVSKQENSTISIMKENVNTNSNFKVDLVLVGPEKNDLGVWVQGTHENKFPISGPTYGNWYNDIVRWEKSYDGGKTFQTVKPNQVDEKESLVLFHREDKDFIVRRVVDWCYNSMNNVSFSTSSEWVKVNRKVNVTFSKINETIEKTDLRINLDFLSDSKESILFSLTKEVNGEKTIIQTVNDFKKISEISTIVEKNGMFYYDIPNIYKQTKNIKYTFEFSASTNDYTRRNGNFTFELDKLSSEIKINSISLSNDVKDSIDIKVAFDKLSIIDDYEVNFVEVDANGAVIKNGYKPAIKKISDSEYQLTKDTSERLYKVEISSNKLGTKTVSNSSFKVSKKETINPEKPNPNPNPEPTPPSQGGDSSNPTLPEDNNGILDSKQNSSSNTSTIAILTTLSLISLIAIVCSIIFFINMKKNNKK